MDRLVVFGVLVALWIVWIFPFLAYKVRAPKREAQVTVTASRWGIFLQMIAYFCAWVGGPDVKPPPVEAVALLFACIGIVLSWTAVHSLGKQLRVHAGLYADHELIRSGPYRMVRHPIYAGMLAMYVATALLQPRWILAVVGFVFFILGIEIRVRIEDGLLASRFGKQFADYKAATPAYIPLLH